MPVLNKLTNLILGHAPVLQRISPDTSCAMNLMGMSRNQFNSIAVHLFHNMGFDVRLSFGCRSTWVGKVTSAEGKDTGEKVVLQVIRSENTVGVCYVRQLFGTMAAENAKRGILLATTGYSKAAFDFAHGKPIELLAEGSFLYLLKEHTGFNAQIIMSDNLE